MKLILPLLFSVFYTTTGFAQENGFTIIRNNAATIVKNQYSSGSCWCFSTTSMAESELLKTNNREFDLSETFTVFNIYIDKATKYLRHRGSIRFDEGGLSQDMLNAIEDYGAMPQSVYSGIGHDSVMANNYEMARTLKKYLDAIIASNPDTIPCDWQVGFMEILEGNLGAPPDRFDFNGKQYTPKTFAVEYIQLDTRDFIGLTSFTHHPFYSTFVMEVPDNYNSNSYGNLPLNELIETVKACINKGYTLTWDADVSNDGFQSWKGLAMWVNNLTEAIAFPNFVEHPYDQTIRQQLFDRQVTQDDHLMQITGLATDAKGNDYFIVKNSYGNRGPYHGYVYVSMPYFAINTISVVVNKKAVPKSVYKKLK